MALLFVGCWWLSSLESEFSIEDVTSAPMDQRLPEEQAVYTGATSIRNRFTAEQIDDMRKEFQVAYLQHNKEIQEAILSGKIFVNGQKTAMANAILLDIDNSTLKVFQEKYKLSRKEMNVLMSGSLP